MTTETITTVTPRHGDRVVRGTTQLQQANLTEGSFVAPFSAVVHLLCGHTLRSDPDRLERVATDRALRLDA